MNGLMIKRTLIGWLTIGYRRLVADQFVPLLLDSEILRARDDVTQSADLLLTVLSPLDESGGGYFVHRRAPWTPVAAFWQRDVTDGSVAFRASTRVAHGTRVDVVLTATDGHFVSSKRLRLSISVRPAQRPAGPKVISISSHYIRHRRVDESHWLGSITVRTLNLRSRGRWFHSW